MVISEKSIYYEVVDLIKNVFQTTHLVDLEYGNKISFWLTHDRRIYGK